MRLFQEILIKNIYDGIDQRWYFDNNTLRYDYILQPYADYRRIKLDIEGAYNYHIKGKDLVFTTRFGEVRQCELQVYQNVNGNRKQIPAKWKKEGKEITFDIANYNPAYELIIDPLVWSTFIGESGATDKRFALKIDSNNDVYIGAVALGTSYPTTTGAYDTSHNGAPDICISKLNNTGSSLIFSTFIGGNHIDLLYDITLDVNNNIYVAGVSQSTDYPVTSGSYDISHNGNYDIVVSKLNSTGSSLQYSTFIGGTSVDNVRAIALDASNNVYIAGHTESSNYPVTMGAYDASFNGTADAVVTKLNATGTSLLLSTFLGGASPDMGYGIALDSSENIYVLGYTESTGFPVTSGCYDNTKDGISDVFVTKLNPAGTSLLYSTYVGGSATELPYDIVVRGTNAYITGTTNSSNYPTTAGAYDASFNGSSMFFDTFVTQINNAGNALVYSTYIGGSDSDVAYSIFVDNSGKATIIGATNSNNFPTTLDGYDTSHNGNNDVFIAQFNDTGTNLLYGSYLGSASEDMGYALAVDNDNNIYCTGVTLSTDFPTKSGAYNTVFTGTTWNVFVTKLGLSSGSSIQNYTLPDTWKVYPTLSKGVFTIETSFPNTFELTDIQGRILKVYENISGQYKASELLEEGMYFIRERKTGTVVKILIY